jgi:hypothetical protein
MSSPLEEFRVGDKVTVHDPLIDEGVVTRVGRKYVTVTRRTRAHEGWRCPGSGGAPRCTCCRSWSPTVRETTGNPPTLDGEQVSPG